MARKPDFEVKDTAEAIRARVKKVGRELNQLSMKVDELNHLYVMYFRGLEKREPYQLRQVLEGRLRAFQMPTMANTVLRFQHGQLLQRMVALRSYWDRTCRSIEEGTFKFGHGSVPVAMAARTKPAPDAASSTETPSQKAKEPEKAETRRFGELYDQYVAACNRDDVQTKVPSYEVFQKTVEKQQKATQKRVGHDRIRYEVRVKEGATKLVAVVKKK